MSKREIIRRMTPGRLAWLTLLRDHGPHVRGRGVTGYQCMRLGWTEWDFRRPDGSPITAEQAHAEYGDGWWGARFQCRRTHHRRRPFRPRSGGTGR